MKILKVLAAALAIAVCTTSCVPVLVGGLIMKSSKNKGQKQEFLSQLQRTNAQREASGLEPLNVCIEMYRFDPGWAADHGECDWLIDSLISSGEIHP